MSTGELKLNVKCQGGDKGQCTCKGAENIPGLKAEKRTNIPVPGFTKYVHWIPDGRTFTLDGELSNGGKIGSEGKIPVKDVTEVAVYYWNGAPDNPILLGITTNSSDNTTTAYYGRDSDSGNDWEQLPGSNEQEALDDQNCLRNYAIPFNIENSHSGDIFKGSKSSCIGSKTIKSTPSSSLTGSNYVTTAYSITNADCKGTKISRVTLNNKPINISLTRDTLATEIRLYSSPVNTNVPIIFEFKLENGNSRLFHSKNEEGTEWQEYGNGNRSYDDNNNISQLTEELIKELDEFTCEHHKGVNIDLSSTRTNGESYCCNKHGGKKKDGNGKVSVTENEVRCKIHNNSSTITYHRHTVSGSYKLSGIRYNENGGTRRNIALNGQRFPIPNVQAIYALYSGNKKEPILIYVEGNTATGWYQKKGPSGGNNGNEEWTKVKDKLNGITPEKFGTLDCPSWNDAVGVLRDCGDKTLEECPEESKQDPQLEQLSSEEAREEVDEEGIKVEKEEEEEKIEVKGGNAPGPGKAASPAGPGSHSTGTAGGGDSEAQTTASIGDTDGGAGVSGEDGGDSDDATERAEEPPDPPANPQPLLTTAPAVLAGYIVPSVFGGSAATFFGGWKLYNRFKGDPWVRYGYPIEFLKNVPY
ncbi:hypothetical protein BEWA_048760 [Theileria equi strain WA]|uniref:Uncharacterized protein n=1 Tax=Theileria equi strain WA TaxID=1537102 RepID=L1LAW7_THEEQ|nr:hypothetical protein BEWA_048760 [Theileria equi strain WA]EKX72409.1 hypothetical protein BEWA_048760 [Theileria equi strain WA]|eukprot:XP_004831861.1 hypothetical protein BEWA_048760 [Theileria equi strain WA]